MLKKLIVSILLLISVLQGFGQTINKVGLLPRLQVATKLSDKYTLTTMIETRHFVFNSKLADKNSIQYNLTDISAFVNHKINEKFSYNLAYTIRITPTIISHRVIQQLVLLHKLNGLNLQQRLGFDQTFNNKNAPVFRSRYRLMATVPLKGKTLESKEFFFNFANEYLGAIQEDKFDLEIRLIPKIGYVLNTKNRVEVGFDYRVNQFISKKIQHVHWWNLTWYATINPKDKIEKRETN